MGVDVNVPFVDRPLPYGALSLDEIYELPVGCLAEADANLFLWTTNRYLPHSFSVAEHWGFSYRQLIVWSKPAGSRPLTPPGALFPNCAEYLLVCRRGHASFSNPWQTNVVEAARATHSAKPELFLDLIESSSPGPYLELFARRNRLGWDTWGHEALNHVEMAS